jgi:hypothetical protein
MAGSRKAYDEDNQTDHAPSAPSGPPRRRRAAQEDEPSDSIPFESEAIAQADEVTEEADPSPRKRRRADNAPW